MTIELNAEDLLRRLRLAIKRIEELEAKLSAAEAQVAALMEKREESKQ